jgi:hypothetical protein
MLIKHNIIEFHIFNFLNIVVNSADGFIEIVPNGIGSLIQ